MSQLASEASANEAKTVRWTECEVDTLVDYLQQHHAEQGGGGFKDTTFANAADHIKHLHVTGKIKDGKSLQNKWNGIW